MEDKNKDLDILIGRLMASTFNQLVWRIAKFNHDGGNKLSQNFLSVQDSNKEVEMIQEELDELKQAFQGLKKVKVNGMSQWVEAEDFEMRPQIADALGDIIYVTIGTACKLGIDIVQVMDEICRSNESKYNLATGQLVKVDGKIQKGPNFKEPDLTACANNVVNFGVSFNAAK